MGRTIDQYHASRESGTGCPETDGGPHYFVFVEPSQNGRSCIDCGEPEQRPNQPEQEQR